VRLRRAVFKKSVNYFGVDMKHAQKIRPNPKLKLMEQVHEVLRYHHYAYKTEQAYSQWILRYIHFFECKIDSLAKSQDLHFRKR
jgi:hypothetical protein